MSVWSPYSPRRIWTLTKVWAALRDFPEAGALVVLVGGTYALAGYTAARNYTPAHECFPSKEMRRDPDLQVAYGTAMNTPSPLYKVAQWSTDDKGYKIGVFDNRARPFEYNFPTQTLAHSSPNAEVDVETARTADAP